MNLLRRLRTQATNLISLFFPKREIHLERRQAWNLTLSQWRKASQLIAESVALSRNLTYQAQLDILRTEHPANHPRPDGLSGHDLLRYLGRIEGYSLCLKNLELMTKPEKERKPLEAVFESPNEKVRK